MSASPEISVVVVTSDRETRLAFLFDALERQTLEADRFEVVVVRDPVPGPTATPPARLSVTAIEQAPGAGLAAARNVGWRAARAPLVAFTDDDCRPAGGWLEALLGAKNGADVIVQGRTEPDPDEAHLLGGLARSQFITGPSPWYETCNIAYPRDLLERLGGFDERFVTVGEDTELALRALEQGARPVYVDQALAWHAVHTPRLPEALSRALEWDVVPELVRRHPAHRRALYGGVFWKESHAKLSLALAGGLLAGRAPGLALLAALPYLVHRVGGRPLRPRRLARRATRLPARLACDLAEVAVTVRAAARWRVVVV